MKEGALHERLEGWIGTNVGEICDLINGRAFKPKEWSSQGLPIIRIQNLNNLNTDFNYCDFDVEEKYLVNNGQLLFAWSGTPGTSFGAHIWKRGKAVLNQHIFKVEINENYINKIFFKYLINRNISEYIRKAHGTAGLAHITKNKFENSTIFIPPLLEQEAIALKIEQLFSDLDNGIENFRKAQAQLKLYRQSVLKAACEGKLVPTEAELARAQGREYEAADVLLARILKERREKWNGKGKYKEAAALDIIGLPKQTEGWCWTSIEQVGYLNEQAVLTGPFGSHLGREDFIDSGVPLLTIGCLTDQGLSLEKAFFVSESKASKLQRYKVRTGDILFSRMATVGRAGFVTAKFEGALINYHLMRLRLAIGAIDPLYFISFVRGSQTVVNYVKKVNHGATRDGINTGQLLALPVALPPLAEQRRIVAEVERRLTISDKMEETITESLQKAKSLRQSILKKAFEGKLLNKKELEKARNAPDWEPAGKLLERIRLEKEIKEKNNKSIRKKIHG